ncbi:LLM class flavin-dependent oxidoreductase [Herbidospora sp. NBRC 101105]|uniref:LLM class flavin-dependent oxidoreductase n=1 Tax=Herbidospora sp. NBRC 101105 TaxID=3032195 RepID=UPI0024A142BA|nr:LLM class flavin-dependent oxidoreductase [Herbidospora sp. NBRC 101105]GLX96497.1 FMNH2-utilizing oxygenase [Herbidospora sp. NBRC 101105]
MSLHLAVALDGAGWHPAAWRAEGAQPDRLFTAGYWADLVIEAERGLLDWVTFEDSLSLQSSRYDAPDDRLDQVRGRLDAVLLAAAVAPLTSKIGLIPTTSVTHTEPFHVAIGIASLDYASKGRAGWRPRVSGRPDEAAHFGRREFPPFDPGNTEFVDALFREASDAVEVVRRLWDSWEDDAEIRDATTGRFIDRDRLHYIDFQGEFFSVKGPSITPRPPQGQPLITALGHSTAPYEFAAKNADVLYVTPKDRDDARRIVEEVRELNPGLKVFADLVVFLGDHKARLDELDGAPLESDAHVFEGTPAQLADLLLDWGFEGYRLRPGVLPHDLTAITRGLVPELQARGAFRTAYETPDLRGRLGLGRPASRYARVS